MANVCFIAALDEQNGIAKKGAIPWDIPSDRKYFRDKVTNGPVLMGWKTYESNKSRPFGNGKNYVVSHRNTKLNNASLIDDAPAFIKTLDEDIWVIGGGEIFRLLMPLATKLYLTRVEGAFDCDVFFPEVTKDFKRTESTNVMHENGYSFWYEVWERTNE